MEKKILISSDGIIVEGILRDSPCSNAIWNSLPVEGSVNLWGKEIYFAIPLALEEDSTAQDVVELGAIAYWPPGRGLCLFFGQTPVSQEGECRAASPVNLIGYISTNLSRLNKIRSGSAITVIQKSQFEAGSTDRAKKGG